MAFRQQEFVDTCAECAEFATTRCKRCDAPHCDIHKPARKARCGRCEEEFALEHPEVRPSALALREVNEIRPSSISIRAMTAGAAVGGVSLLLFIALMSVGGLPVISGVAAGGIIVGFLLGMLGLAGFFAKAAGDTALTSGAQAIDATRRRLHRRARKKFLREHKPRALLPAGED